ncbi:MAG: GDP-mannose 4,6-dehydratase [Methanoregula sp.]
MATRRIVVLGSNSFSGSDLIDLLLENPHNEVVGMSRSKEKDPVFLPYKQKKSENFTFHQMDLNHDITRIVDLLDAFKPDYIINFAAQSEVAPSWEHPEQWFQTNVVSLAKFINAIKDRKYLKKYVHISSPEVYGACVGTVTESAPINPSTPYAASKAAADLFLFTMYKNYNFPLVMIRSTNVYGAHQQLFKIIPKSVISIKLGKKIPLHGGGQAVKSYIHIRDISKGELAAMEKGRIGSIYHLSPDRGYSVKDVVSKICTHMGTEFTKCTTIVDERPGQDAAYVIDSTRARSELGWMPTITLDNGLNRVIDWVNDNWTSIQKYPYEYIHKE